MVITIICVYALVMMGSRHGSMVPGRLQSLVEMVYDFIADMIESNAGREGRKYFPFFFNPLHLRSGRQHARHDPGQRSPSPATSSSPSPWRCSW